VAEKHSKGELSIFICSFRHKQLHLNVSMPYTIIAAPRYAFRIHLSKKI
jgi:hypothetical protein